MRRKLLDYLLLATGLAIGVAFALGYALATRPPRPVLPIVITKDDLGEPPPAVETKKARPLGAKGVET